MKKTSPQVNMMRALALALALALILPSHALIAHAKKSESTVYYTVRMRRVHPETLDSLTVGDVITDSVGKGRIGTLVHLSVTPHTVETYSAAEDRMVSVPHPYYRDAVLTVSARATRQDTHYAVGAYKLLLGRTVHFFTPHFVGSGECTAVMPTLTQASVIPTAELER